MICTTETRGHRPNILARDSQIVKFVNLLNLFFC